MTMFQQRRRTLAIIAGREKENTASLMRFVSMSPAQARKQAMLDFEEEEAYGTKALFKMY